jgi:hypothetical protein
METLPAIGLYYYFTPRVSVDFDSLDAGKDGPLRDPESAADLVHETRQT